MRPLRARIRTSTGQSGARLSLPVERRVALLGHLSRVGALHVDLLARSQLLGREFLGTPAKAGRDVAPIDPQLAPVAVDAANDDVRVRVARVVVVDCRPLDLAADVALERGHEAPHVGGKVELRTVLGRDDESKLVLLARAGLLEGPAAHGALRVVEHALGTVLLDAVALDVAHVQGRRFGGAWPHALHVGLDDDAPRARLAGVYARFRSRGPRTPRTDA
jgi:hypothetical protein